jgi:hypothetical protein
LKADLTNPITGVNAAWLPLRLSAPARRACSGKTIVCHVTMRWLTLLGFESRGLTNSNEGETKVTNTRIGRVTLVIEILTNH